jgi:leader peptidase (prepilin peptidase)/N-methyltransferase
MACVSAVIGAVVLAAVVASIAAAPGMNGILGAGLAVTMAAIAVIDARHFIIPNSLNAVALALAFLNAVMQAPDAIMDAVLFAALRGAMLALIFLGIREGYRRLRGRDGLGLGDVKLAGVAGAWLDWLTIPVAVQIAALTALAIYLLRSVIGKQPIRASGRLPFGLFFAPAIWLCWLLETTLLARF